jgi:hypothetical protein
MFINYNTKHYGYHFIQFYSLDGETILSNIQIADSVALDHTGAAPIGVGIGLEEMMQSQYLQMIDEDGMPQSVPVEFIE